MPPHDWYASPGVKKLGGKKLGGAKIAKTSATTDWDNTDAALTANEPDAAPVDDFTSEADGLGQLTGKSRALVLRCTTATQARVVLNLNVYRSPRSCLSREATARAATRSTAPPA